MIDTVTTLANNYGLGSKERAITNISRIEAKEALRVTKGNVWAAVTECVDARKKKVSMKILTQQTIM